MLQRLPQVLERIDAIEALLAGMSGSHASAAGRRPAFEGLLDGMLTEGAGGTAPAAHVRSGAARSGGRDAFDAIIERAARREGLSADLLHAVIRAESNYDPRCRSSAGAMGLMQLMPGTARGLGVTDPWDPEQNVLGGARYLRRQIDRFGDLELALAAYNAGPGAVTRHGGIPPYRETQTYVRRVIGYLQQRGVSAQAGSSSTGDDARPGSTGAQAVQHDAMVDPVLVAEAVRVASDPVPATPSAHVARAAGDTQVNDVTGTIVRIGTQEAKQVAVTREQLPREASNLSPTRSIPPAVNPASTVEMADARTSNGPRLAPVTVRSSDAGAASPVGEGEARDRPLPEPPDPETPRGEQLRAIPDAAPADIPQQAKRATSVPAQSLESRSAVPSGPGAVNDGSQLPRTVGPRGAEPSSTHPKAVRAQRVDGRIAGAKSAEPARPLTSGQGAETATVSERVGANHAPAAADPASETNRSADAEHLQTRVRETATIRAAAQPAAPPEEVSSPRAEDAQDEPGRLFADDRRGRGSQERISAAGDSGTGRISFEGEGLPQTPLARPTAVSAGELPTITIRGAAHAESGARLHPEIARSPTAQLSQGRSERLLLEVDPPHLGRCELELTMRDGELRATIIAERPETVATMRAARTQVRAQLAEQGLDVTQFDVRGGSEQGIGDDAGRRRYPAQTPPPPPMPRYLREQAPESVASHIGARAGHSRAVNLVA